MFVSSSICIFFSSYVFLKDTFSLELVNIFSSSNLIFSLFFSVFTDNISLSFTNSSNLFFNVCNSCFRRGVDFDTWLEPPFNDPPTFTVSPSKVIILYFDFILWDSFVAESNVGDRRILPNWLVIICAK